MSEVIQGAGKGAAIGSFAGPIGTAAGALIGAAGSFIGGQQSYKNQKKLIDYQTSKGYDLLVMMFTSVNADGTMFLFFGPRSNVMFDVIETKFDANSGYDTSILSRKQELVPKLSKALQV